MDKKIKKEYDKRRTNVLLTMSHKELTVLESMMEKDGWTNRSGFIKDRLFGENIDSKYARTLKKGSQKDTPNAIQNLLQELVDEFGYLNYRYNAEIEKLEKVSDKRVQKKISMLYGWQKNIRNYTDDMTSLLEAILKMLHIKVAIEQKEAIKHVPDSVLEEKAKDWNDVDSPELYELARRVIHEYREQQDAQDDEK